MERGLVAPDELAAGRSLRPAKAVKRTLAARDTAGLLQRGGPTSREAPRPARFEVGGQVRAKNMHPVTHTRLPRYVRGHTGVIEMLQPAALLPDTHAHFQGENQQHVYSVRFESRELWGADAEPFAPTVEMFDSYLESV